jgi:uncharacterized membrane protein YesL
MNNLIDKIHNISNWILRLLYLNLLWIFFSLLGFVLLGFFPATLSMFILARKWILGETDIPIFKSFWFFYKKEFFKSNFLGVFFFIIGLVLFSDLLFLQRVENNLLHLFYIPVIMLIIIYTVTLLYTFTIYAHYDLKGFQIIKNAFLISFISPLQTIIMFTCFIVLGYFLIALPGLIIFFSGSLLSFIIMLTAKYAFDNFEKKRKYSIKEN